MRGWDSEKVYFSGDLFYSALLRDIESARATIEFETYIFTIDKIGERVLEALARAAARGVSVRLLIDGVGSYTWTLADLETWRARKLLIRVFHPLPWQTHRTWIWEFLKQRWFSTSRSWMNRRNHRKVTILDGKVAYLGGMNICANHSTECSGLNAWRDTMVRVEGARGVRTLRQAFEMAWRMPRKKKFWRRLRRRAQKVAGFGLVRLNYSRRARLRFHRELFRRLVRAQKRIWITTPYFVPPPSIYRALRVAAWSGVDVRILVPAKNDVWFMKIVGRAYYGALQASGARIFEYEPSILHAKTTIIDDWVTVGSANYNHRSFLHDLEVEVRLVSPEATLTLERQFLADQHESREVLPWRWRRRMFWMRITERLMLRFRYWI